MAGTDVMDLTIEELGVIGRKIKADPMEAIGKGGQHRWTALALVLWMIDRRTDPHAKAETYLAMTLGEVQRRHAENDEAVAADAADEDDADDDPDEAEDDDEAGDELAPATPDPTPAAPLS